MQHPLNADQLLVHLYIVISSDDVQKKRRPGQIANNKNNLYHNCLDGGMFVQSPNLMGI